ncbi:MAG: glycosyltransferase family 2 protein [Fibrella sp.]|nr:glycosyltransferase family 2 protein [Armatimonadota bacterium]
MTESLLQPRPVTVIMRSKNSDWVIAQALAALFSQTFTDFELLVADSGSTDRTLEIVAEYPHRLLRIEPEEYFPGAVLNRAIGMAEGRIIVFLNSDAVLLTTDALTTLLTTFNDPVVMAAFGRQLPRSDAHTWVRRDYAVAFPAQKDAPKWLPFSQVFSALRKSAWEAQPFYTAAWGSEDVEWGVRARCRSWDIRYVQSAMAMHSHNYTLHQLYGRRFIEGEADAFIYGGDDSLPKMVVRILRTLAHDLLSHQAARDLNGLLASPFRGAIAQWGYYQGHRHGEKRIANNDSDARTGQQTVLRRHESVRGAKV